MTLLYVDDDPDDIEVFTDAVKKVAPYTLLYTCISAKDAFNKLNEIAVLPDYIFMDMNMPEITGIEFLRSIKGTANLKDLPVVIYSTSIAHPDAEACKKLGAIDLIAKPTEFHQLCEILKRYI